MTTATFPITAPLGSALFELAAVAVLVVDDASWRVVASNDAAEALYGGSMAGVAVENLFGLEGEAAVEQVLRRAESSAEPVELSFEGRLGEMRRVRVRARRVALDGCPVRLVTVL